MLLLRWLLNALALILVAYLVPGVAISSLWAALVAALVLGLLNATLRPLLTILTLPVTLLTLGLFSLVLNALMLLLVSSIVKGFTVDGFGAAFWAAVILWLISWFSNFLFAAAPAAAKS